MKLSYIAKTLFSISTLCGIVSAQAGIAESELSDINRKMLSRNGFSEASALMMQSTEKAAGTPEEFERYLVAIASGVKNALKQRDIDFSDVLGISQIANHLDGWARAMPGGMGYYTHFIESVAEASKSARPASFGGQLGCQMQLVLFSLAIDAQDVAKAETARKAALALSKYDSEAGFAQFGIPILDVAFTLISKDSAAALSLYREQHKKLLEMDLADVEEMLWSQLVILKEKGLSLGELEPIKKEMDSRFNKGVRIRKVYPNTAAAKAGWRKGDRIVEIDGKTILYNSDDGGRTHLQAVLNRRRSIPNRKPTKFKLKRGESFLTSEIAEDSLGILF